MGWFKRSAKKDDQPDPADKGAEPRHITAEEFDAVILGSQMPAIVDFWAEWCGPCRAIAPAVSQLAAEFDGRALVAKVNTDDCPDIVMRYGIMGIPTLIYFKDGIEVDRVVGLTGYPILKGKLEKLLG